MLLLGLWTTVLPTRSASDYRWENRLVVVFSDTSDSSLVKQQVQAFDGLEQDIEERHMRLLLVADRDHPWRERFRVKESDFQVILVGKDGGVKYRSNEPVAPEVFFQEIDQMPMRRREMREN